MKHIKIDTLLKFHKFFQSWFTLMYLSIGTPKNSFFVCPKWKIHYFQVSQNLGREYLRGLASEFRSAMPVGTLK